MWYFNTYITFYLHLALNTFSDKGIQSFLTIPDIEQKRLCCKLSPHLTWLFATKVNVGFLLFHKSYFS